MMLRYLLILALASCANAYRILCYYDGAARLRTASGKCDPEQIDSFLCTHIVYAYVNVIGLEMPEPTSFELDTFSRLRQLRALNPDLKLMLAIAGNFYNWKYSFIDIVATAPNRASFVNSLQKYLIKHGFDGVEVNVYYPNTRRMPPISSFSITGLFGALRKNFDANIVIAETSKLILSASLPSSKYLIDGYYDVYTISTLVDFISITSFDFRGGWDDKIGFGAGLFPHKNEQGWHRQFNVNWAAMYYTFYAIPRQKLNIGIPTFGRTFTMKYIDAFKIGSPSLGMGLPGLFTNTSGLLAYYEICDFINIGAVVIDVPSSGSRYAFKGNQWVGYDDIQSVTDKSCYVKKNNFGGVTVRTLDYDDFFGLSCHKGKFPLIKAISRILKNNTMNDCKILASKYSRNTASNLEAFKTGIFVPFIMWSVAVLGIF